MIRFERYQTAPLIKGGAAKDSFARLCLNPSIPEDADRVMLYFRKATNTVANGGLHSLHLWHQPKFTFNPQEPWVDDGEAYPAIGAAVSSGNWDASSGAYPSGASKGDEYTVSVGGTVDGATYAVGNVVQALKDSPATDTTVGNWTKGNFADPAFFAWTDGEKHAFVPVLNNGTGQRRLLHIKSTDGTGLGAFTLVGELLRGGTYFGADGPCVQVIGSTAYGLFTVDDTDGGGYSLVLKKSTDLETWADLPLRIEDSPISGAYDDESLLAVGMEVEGDYLKIYAPGGGVYGDKPEGVGLYRVAIADIETATEAEEYPHNPVFLRGPAGGFDEGGIWSFRPFNVNGSKWAVYEGTGTGLGGDTPQSNAARDDFYGQYNITSFSSVFMVRDRYPEAIDQWDNDPAIPDDRYYIRHASGGYLSSIGDGITDLTKLTITHDRTQPSTVWHVDKQNDFYRISLAAAGDPGLQCLELEGSRTANRKNGQDATLFPWGGFVDQQWHFVNVGPHREGRAWLQIANRESGQVLETRDGAPGRGAVVEQQPASGRTRQQWEFIRVHNGTEVLVTESGDGSIIYPPDYPDASDVVTLNGTQTLANKTITNGQYVNGAFTNSQLNNAVVLGEPDFSGLTDAAKDKVRTDLRLAKEINITQFGAVAKGDPDLTADQINEAELYAQSVGAELVYPAGRYHIGKTVVFRRGVRRRFEGVLTNWRPNPSTIGVSQPADMYTEESGVEFILCGTPSKDFSLKHISDMAHDGGRIVNPSRPYGNADDEFLQPTNFTNADAAGVTPATSRDFSVGVYWEQGEDQEATPRSFIDNLRIVPSCPGDGETYGTGGYADPVSGGALRPWSRWDVGLFVESPWGVVVEGAQIVGYYDLKGCLITGTKTGSNQFIGYAEKNVFERCIFQSGLSFRLADSFEIQASTSNTITVNWSPSHQFDPAGGSIRVGSFFSFADASYTGLSYDGGAGTLTLTGVTGVTSPAPGLQIILSGGAGFAKTVLYDCEVNDLCHHSRLDQTHPSIALPYSAALEVVGDTIRAISFYNCLMPSTGPIAAFVRGGTDLEFYSCWIEPRGYRTGIGGGIANSGSAFIMQGGRISVYGRTFHPNISLAPLDYVSPGGRLGAYPDTVFFAPMTYWAPREREGKSNSDDTIWGLRGQHFDRRVRDAAGALRRVWRSTDTGAEFGFDTSGNPVISAPVAGNVQIAREVEIEIDGVWENVGRPLRDKNGAYLVHNWGTVVDGTTDNSGAFQACVNHAIANGLPANFYFKAGNWTFASRIDMTAVLTPINLTGVRNQTILRPTAFGGADVFMDFPESTPVTIEGIKIEGNNSSKNDPIGLNLRKAGRVVLRDFDVSGLGNTPIYITNATNADLVGPMNLFFGGWQPVHREVPFSTTLSTTADSTTITASAAVFAANDVGKDLWIMDNMTSPKLSRVATYVSPTEITLLDPMVQTATGVKFSYTAITASLVGTTLTFPRDISLAASDVGRHIYIHAAREHGRTHLGTIASVTNGGECVLTTAPDAGNGTYRIFFTPAVFMGAESGGTNDIKWDNLLIEGWKGPGIITDGGVFIDIGNLKTHGRTPGEFSNWGQTAEAALFNNTSRSSVHRWQMEKGMAPYGGGIIRLAGDLPNLDVQYMSLTQDTPGNTYLFDFEPNNTTNSFLGFPALNHRNDLSRFRGIVKGTAEALRRVSSNGRIGGANAAQEASYQVPSTGGPTFYARGVSIASGAQFRFKPNTASGLITVTSPNGVGYTGLIAFREGSSIIAGAYVASDASSTLGAASKLSFGFDPVTKEFVIENQRPSTVVVNVQ